MQDTSERQVENVQPRWFYLRTIAAVVVVTKIVIVAAHFFPTEIE